MHRLLALLLLASLAVACGGGSEGAKDDGGGDAPAAEAAVVRSSDGRAELRLPPGVSADGIAVEPVTIDGAAAAFELTPSGLTFDEPATLTITNLEAPEPGAMPYALLQADGEAPEPVDSVADYGDGTSATVELAITHFSRAWVHFSVPGLDSLAGGGVATISLRSPRDVTAGVPFDVTARIGGMMGGHGSWEGWNVDYVQYRGRGTVSAGNAAPAKIEDIPSQQVLQRDMVAEHFEGTKAFTCQRTGRVRLTYLVHMEIDYVVSTAGGKEERSSTATTRTRVRREPLCSVPGASSSTTSVTDEEEDVVKPVVSLITIELNVPVTTYRVEASDPEGRQLVYEWKLSGEDCGEPRAPFTEYGAMIRWSHADAPPDSCQHRGPDHDVTVSVTVASERGSVTCIVHGTETQRIENPNCV